MAIPPERSPEAHTRGASDSDDLLRLTAEIIGLEAAAVVVLDDGGAVVLASWPVDRAGLELPDLAADELTRLLESLGGTRGERLLSAPLDGEGGLGGVLCGVAETDEPHEESERTLETLAGLVGSRLQLDGARRRAEEAGARMASLVEAGLSLSRELRLDDLLQRIVQAAREVVGARYAALGVLDADRTELVEFVTDGLSQAEREAIGDLPRGRGLLGALIRDARPLRLERISDDPRSVGFPENHPPMQSFLGVPVGFRGQVYGNLYLTDKVGGPFTEEDEQIALTLASQGAVAVDNVHRLEVERRRADELESVQEVARAVLTTLDVDSLLPLVARRARRLTGAETVGVAVGGGDDLVFRYAHGVDALTLEGARVPPEMGAVRSALERTLGAVAVEACALELDDVVVGALVAVGSRPFDDHARRLLSTFSSHVALALANARAVGAKLKEVEEDARREAAAARERAAGEGVRLAIEAQDAERARLARELHDEAGQALTALAVHMRALEGDVPEGPLRDRVAELRGQVGSATMALRELATRLRPSALQEGGLATAIEEQAERVRASTGMQVDVDLRGLDADLPEDVQIALFRVVQEALTNVVRHSGATSISIVATARESHVRLVVDDDGCGFDPSAPTDRLGLAGIGERVELLGGGLRVESSPGGGTAVVVDLEVS
ncbi:MAG TPA: GAF domain-containing sensor histidine kinase [Miltoncostaeaceae bacterium]|nr:GAF domain-containing sensor histidine kinase [Miltoncostaeaceae bacterium]